MDQINYTANDFQETSSGNKVAKKAQLRGTDWISLAGKCIIYKDTILRADLAKIQCGRYAIIHENVMLKPSYTYYTKEQIAKSQSSKPLRSIMFNSIQIGDYVMIEAGSIIQASKIGSATQIGKNCTIGARSVIGECSVILDDTIISPDSVVAPYSVYGGRPGIYISEMPEMSYIIQKQRAMNYYKNFIPKN